MNNSPQILLSEGNYKENRVVFIDFEFDWKIVNLLRIFKGAQFIYAEKRWYILSEDFDLPNFFNHFKPVAFVDYSALQKKNQFLLQKENKVLKPIELKNQLPCETYAKINDFKAWMRQMRYSKNTIKSYIHQLEIFFGYYQL